ncbi:hypothetical protein B9Z19DRAFT_1079788 [Tuber borchii]|uniref:Uncharacterized protein n=1 Tax=Tuber borchii TaxID=42251 RepID=A0A2T6ZXJ9_TUBBO|nr:hypothetical protein B9Z19DRAFT_1079788 [Tuber borchii]
MYYYGVFGFVYIFGVSAFMILGISYGAGINKPLFVPICSAEFLKSPQFPTPFLPPLRSPSSVFSLFFIYSRGVPWWLFLPSPVFLEGVRAAFCSLLHFLFGLVPVVYSIQYI